jgi:hypothetical protein
MLRRRLEIKSLIWIGTFLLALGITATSRAQFQMPQVPGFSGSYPWFNDIPQYERDQSFQWFLAHHPSIASALSRNPSLLYNAGWRSESPALQQYLANHPGSWQELNGRNWAEGPTETRWGDYDDQHQWRDAYWWHRNNPNRFYDHHDEWTSLDSRWRDQDGAFDGQRRWHYGEWWYNRNPNWVASNHPDWLREHRNWEEQSEQQNYRQRQAMIQANERYQNRQERETTQQENQRGQRPVIRQNQQRMVDQRQANLQQRETMRQDNHRQQQINQQNQRQQIDRLKQRQQASREQAQPTHQQGQRALQSRHTEQQANEHQMQSRQESAASKQPREGIRRQDRNGAKQVQ